MITWMEAARESVLIAAEIAAVKAGTATWTPPPLFQATYTPPLNSMQAMPWLFKIWPGSEQLLSKVLPTNRLLPKGVQGRVGARDENDGDGGLNDDEENVTKVIFGLGTE